MSNDRSAARGSDERLEALTLLLRSGVPGPTASTRSEHEAQLRTAAARRPAESPSRAPRRTSLAALALLAAFALGRLSWSPSASGPKTRIDVPAEPSPRGAAKNRAPVPSDPHDKLGSPTRMDRSVTAPSVGASIERAAAPRRHSRQASLSASTKTGQEKPRGPIRRANSPSAIPIGRGFGLLRAGRFEAAAAAFSHVARSGPSAIRPDAAYLRAVCLARAGRGKEAIEAFRRFLDDHPNHRKSEAAQVALGWILVDKKRWDEASAAFDAAHRSVDRSIALSAKRGRAHLSSRRPLESSRR